MQSTPNPATLRGLTIVYTLAYQPNTHTHTFSGSYVWTEIIALLEVYDSPYTT